MQLSLLSEMHIENSRIITLVGAGGKTSLMYSLGKEMSPHHKTLLTTTTHIMEPRDLPGARLITEENQEQLITAFQSSRLVALGLPLSATDRRASSDRPDFLPDSFNTSDRLSAAFSPKWSSPSLSFLEKIRDIPERILCEGDGSRRLPVKVPRTGEPVFFPGTDTVIGVIGLSCLGRPVETCLFGWTPDLDFPALQATLQKSGGRMTPEALAIIALSSSGLKKNITTQKYHVIFNQADCLRENELPEIIKAAQKIRDNGTNCHIVSLKKEFLIHFSIADRSPKQIPL